MSKKQILTMYLATAIVFFAIGVFVCEAKAGEVSLSTQALNTQSSWIYTDQSDRLQVNFGDEKYYFLSAERLQICPYYCVMHFQLYGGGVGKNIDFGKFELFGQMGAYYVTNSHGKEKWNESIYYYMTQKFHKASFDSYKTTNDNIAIGGTIGVNIPLSESVMMKLYYRHVQFETNFYAYFKNGSYWHDPTMLKFTGTGVGLAWRF